LRSGFAKWRRRGTNLILSGFAAWGSLHGFGPFANNQNAPLLLEMFVFVVCTMTLALSAAVAERRRAEEDLVVAQSILSQLVRQKTSDLNDTLEAPREGTCERIKSQHALQGEPSLPHTAGRKYSRRVLAAGRTGEANPLCQPFL
jgi:hypothetical protein